MRPSSCRGTLTCLVAACALLGAGMGWHGFWMNSSAWFYGGLISSSLAAAVLVHRTSLGVAQGWEIAVHTYVLLVLALGLLEWVPINPAEASVTGGKAYSYRDARGNPHQFRKWWARYCSEWDKIRHAVEMPDPTGVLPFVLRPNTTTRFFDGEVHINSLGFRPDFHQYVRTR